APSSSSSSRTYLDRSALERPILRAAAEKPSASTTSMKARMRVNVSMRSRTPRARLFKFLERLRQLRSAHAIFQPDMIFSLIVTGLIPISRLPKVARACGCPPVPRLVRDTVRYLELTPPVGQTANRLNRGHLEATTVRAFL